MAILTVTQLREHITSTLSDDAVQRLLDAAEELILQYVGGLSTTYESLGAVNELITSHGELLMLSRRAETIDTVIERTTTLAANDYQLRSSGDMLRRLNTGTNPSWRGWWGRVDITYTPLSDSALRELVQIELVKLDISSNSTLASQTIGAWSETFGTAVSHEQQRFDILASLTPPADGIW